MEQFAPNVIIIVAIKTDLVKVLCTSVEEQQDY